jgi:aryl sulfotransferase
VSERVWLASYPKSGNNWMRMLIGCLALKDVEAIDINQTAEAGGISSSRVAFDFVTLLESGMMTFDEIDRLRPRVYEVQEQNLQESLTDEAETSATVFVKAHDAYTLNSLGEPILAGARGARGVILIVRDPRDMVASLANHNQSTLDQAIASMSTPEDALCSKPGRQHNQLRQIMLGWSGHAASWLDQQDIPVHLVRYEQLKQDTVNTFVGAMAFAGRPISTADAERAVQLADFSQLQAREREQGFGERPPKVTAFFRKGQMGGWRDELTDEQVQRIEDAHRPMMERLGYEPSMAAQRAVSA